MSFESKEKLQAIVSAANAATGESDQTVTDAVQTLIDGYGSQPLPPLTNPASSGDILSGKEAIDGNGDKQTGTLEICESVALDDILGVYDGMANIQVASSKDYSQAEISWPEPDALTENIVSGKTIFGVDGTAKKIVKISGAYTVGASDITTYINVAGLIYPRAFSLSIPYENAVSYAAAIGKNVVWKIDAMQNKEAAAYAALTYVTPPGGQLVAVCPVMCNNTRTRIYLSLSGVASVDAVFPAAARYDWIGYYWEENG